MICCRCYKTDVELKRINSKFGICRGCDAIIMREAMSIAIGIIIGIIVVGVIVISASLIR